MLAKFNEGVHANLTLATAAARLEAAPTGRQDACLMETGHGRLN